MEFFAGTQFRRWKIRLIRTIGEMLGLEAESGAKTVDVAAFAFDASVQMIARVELHARLGCVDFKRSAGLGIDGACRERQTLLRSVQDKIVIVARAQLKLLMRLIDTFADSRFFPEIEGRSCHALQFAGGNLVLIDWCKKIGIQRDQVIEHISFSLAG
jgi:hypothetical protein